MAVKFAEEIVKEIRNRNFSVPENCFTGEPFEAWLKRKKPGKKPNLSDISD